MSREKLPNDGMGCRMKAILLIYSLRLKKEQKECTLSSGDSGETLHCVEQIVRQQRLQTEDYIEAGVFLFRFCQTADDEHWNVGCKPPDFSHECGAVHTRHHVVRDDQIDVAGELIIAKLLQRAFRAEHRDDELSSPIENGLARRRLNGVVINEENCSRHAFPCLSALAKAHTDKEWHGAQTRL